MIDTPPELVPVKWLFKQCHFSQLNSRAMLRLERVVKMLSSVGMVLIDSCYSYKKNIEVYQTGCLTN